MSMTLGTAARGLARTVPRLYAGQSMAVLLAAVLVAGVPATSDAVPLRAAGSVAVAAASPSPAPPAPGGPATPQAPTKKPAPAQAPSKPPVPGAKAPSKAPAKAPASAPSTARRNPRDLRVGDRGKKVRTIQKRLRVPRTGIFDQATLNAVRAVQRAAGLPATGIADARTRKAIKRDYKAYRAKVRAAKRAQRPSSRGLPRAGSPASSKRYARAYIDRRYGWGSKQHRCLVLMWTRESHWRYRASNPNGRYHGIPQTSRGVWRGAGYSTTQYMRSPAVQIRVGAHYIKKRYGTPCKAWAFWRAHHWY